MNKRVHFQQKSTFDFTHHRSRAFFGFFRRNKKTVRPGAMSAAALKNTIEAIEVGAVIEILRVGFDGVIDDLPIIIELTNADKTGFSGKVVNVERAMIEKNTNTTVYAKRGGGIIEFNYNDGDIKEVKKNEDYAELAEMRNVGELVEVLHALEEQDRILVAFFDKQHNGTVNVEGTLTTSLVNNSEFAMTVDRINGVNLDSQIDRKFDIEKEMVIDVSIV